MRFKRAAVSEIKKEEKEFKQARAKRAKLRAAYRKKHPKRKGEKRGRPRLRTNEKFKPSILSTRDTKVELLTRARYILPKSGEKWSERQKQRAELMFELCPKLKEAHALLCQLRAIFRNKKLSRDDAKIKLKEGYKAVSSSRIKEIISARDCIKSKEDKVLNYFNNRSTNASAESLNSKMKGFRSELRGVTDLPFYMFRCSMIFG